MISLRAARYRKNSRVSNASVSAFRAAGLRYTVPMYRTQDLHVKEIVPLSSPGSLKAQTPTTEAANATVARSRERIIRILRQEDPRLLVVIGPCSIHDEKSALEYATKLSDGRNAQFTQFSGYCRARPHGHRAHDGQSARARRVAGGPGDDELRRGEHPGGGGETGRRKTAAGADGGLQPCEFRKEIRQAGGRVAQRDPAAHRRHEVADRPDGGKPSERGQPAHPEERGGFKIRRLHHRFLHRLGNDGTDAALGL